MQFTNNWFNENSILVWAHLIPATKPAKILEIGSYEGASICYLIETLGNMHDLEIHAIDTWAGGNDHISKDLMTKVLMNEVEERFYKNTKECIGKVSHKVDLKTHKGPSDIKLSLLMCSGFRDYFDFIYVDGSHETTDTLLDCALAFRMLKPKGVMVIDDYLWSVDSDMNYRPKLAIDAFVNINLCKIDIINAPNSQMYLAKK